LSWDVPATDGINPGTLCSAVIALLAQREDADTLREGNERFKRAFVDGEEKAVAPDLQAIVYKIVCLQTMTENENEKQTRKTNTKNENESNCEIQTKIRVNKIVRE
jgi:hypothetical protein